MSSDHTYSSSLFELYKNYIKKFYIVNMVESIEDIHNLQHIVDISLDALAKTHIGTSKASKVYTKYIESAFIQQTYTMFSTY